MNAHRRTAGLFALMVAAPLMFCRAAENPNAPPAPNPAEVAQKTPAKPTAAPLKPPSEAALRSMITKSLGFLAKEGEQWMTDKNCTSCHHMPELLWSHREAKKRGFPIDEKKYDEWSEWSVERATDTRAGLEEAAMMILALPERPAPELTKLITAAQQADGTWKPASQPSTMQKRGAADAQDAFTRLSLIALATHQPKGAEVEAARAKAAAALQKTDSPTSIEALVFRSIDARHFGKLEEADALRDQIVKHQRGDGGWSSFIGENMSDPLATGQALWALQSVSSDAPTADAIARAQHWLLKTQREDGSWPIDITHISKIDRSAPDKAHSFKAATGIYEYWGSGWATIGLLHSVPVKE